MVHNKLIQELASYNGRIPLEELRLLIKRYEKLAKGKYLKYYCGFDEEIMPYTDRKGKKIRQELSNKGMNTANYQEYRDIKAIIKKLKNAEYYSKEQVRQDKYAYNIHKATEAVKTDGFIEQDDDAWIVEEYESGYDEAAYGEEVKEIDDVSTYGEEEE